MRRPSSARLSWISNFSVSYEGSKYVQSTTRGDCETTLVNLRLGIRSDDGWSIVASAVTSR